MLSSCMSLLWIIWAYLQCLILKKIWYPLHLALFLFSGRYSINFCGMKEYLNEQTDVLKYVFPVLLKCRARLSRTKSSNSLGTCTTSPFPSCPSFVALWFASELHASGKCQISAQQTVLYSRYRCLQIDKQTGWVSFWDKGSYVKARNKEWNFMHSINIYWESILWVTLC